MKHVVWLVALVGCTESSAENVSPFAKPPPAATLTVELAAVTLADDCGSPPPPVPT